MVRARAGEISPPVDVGDRLPRRVHVGAHASLTLAWSFALSDTAEITGPADLTLGAESPPSLSVTAGRAEIATVGAFEIRTSEATIHGGAGASWALEVGEGRTRVRSLGGVVRVRADERERVLRVGEELTLPEPIELPRPNAAAPPDGPDPVQEFARGVASLTTGDRAAAQRSFRLVADSSRATPSLRRRASFRWAELALARGERTRAQTELTTLLGAPDPALAADAAFLLARAASTPSACAEVWARYLAQRPEAPYRDDALLERASALLAAGRRADADAALDGLATDPALTKEQESRLRAVQSRIWR